MASPANSRYTSPSKRQRLNPSPPTPESLGQDRNQALERLKASWDEIASRYAAIEEDGMEAAADVFDLSTGEIVEDRGWLRNTEKMPFGSFTLSESESENQSEDQEGSDEDEENQETDCELQKSLASAPVAKARYGSRSSANRNIDGQTRSTGQSSPPISQTSTASSLFSYQSSSTALSSSPSPGPAPNASSKRPTHTGRLSFSTPFRSPGKFNAYLKSTPGLSMLANQLSLFSPSRTIAKPKNHFAASPEPTFSLEIASAQRLKPVSKITHVPRILSPTTLKRRASSPSPQPSDLETAESEFEQLSAFSQCTTISTPTISPPNDEYESSGSDSEPDELPECDALFSRSPSPTPVVGLRKLDDLSSDEEEEQDRIESEGVIEEEEEEEADHSDFLLSPTLEPTALTEKRESSLYLEDESDEALEAHTAHLEHSPVLQSRSTSPSPQPEDELFEPLSEAEDHSPPPSSPGREDSLLSSSPSPSDASCSLNSATVSALKINRPKSESPLCSARFDTPSVKPRWVVSRTPLKEAAKCPDDWSDESDDPLALDEEDF